MNKPDIKKMQKACDDFNAACPIGDLKADILRNQVTDRMTQFKSAELLKQGYQIVGHVMQKDGQRTAISSHSAVRWLTDAEYWDLMHPTSLT